MGVELTMTSQYLADPMALADAFQAGLLVDQEGYLSIELLQVGVESEPLSFLLDAYKQAMIFGGERQKQALGLAIAREIREQHHVIKKILGGLKGKKETRFALTAGEVLGQKTQYSQAYLGGGEAKKIVRKKTVRCSEADANNLLDQSRDRVQAVTRSFYRPIALAEREQFNKNLEALGSASTLFNCNNLMRSLVWAKESVDSGLDPILVVHNTGADPSHMASLFSDRGRGNFPVDIRSHIRFIDNYGYKLAFWMVRRSATYLTLEVKLPASQLAKWAVENLKTLVAEDKSETIPASLMLSFFHWTKGHGGSVKILAIPNSKRIPFENPFLNEALKASGFDPSATIVQADLDVPFATVARWYSPTNRVNAGKIRHETNRWAARLVGGLEEERDELIHYWIELAKALAEKKDTANGSLGNFLDVVLPQWAVENGLIFPREVARAVDLALRYPFTTIQAFIAINGFTVRELELRMRPGAMSKSGFLGEEESLIEVMAEDNESVLSAGYTHQKIAEAAREFLRESKAEKDQGKVRFSYHGEIYEVEVMHDPGYQLSPFNDGTRGANDFIIERVRDEKTILVSELLIEMIDRYGFYEGKETEYRVDPKDLIDFFKPHF